MVARMSAEEDLQLKLLDTINKAKECKGDECLVMWDDVEELSAAMAHSGKKAVKTGGEMTKEDKEQLEKIVVKYSEDEMSQVEAKIIEAITTAQSTKSAVDWEVVEELMAQKSHLKKFGGST